MKDELPFFADRNEGLRFSAMPNLHNRFWCKISNVGH